MSDQSNNEKTVLGPGCTVRGELTLDDDALVLGQVEGTLRVSGMLDFGKSAAVQGTVMAGAVRIAGNVHADVIAEHGLELLDGSTLTGALYTKRLSIREGATYEGDINVGPRAMDAAAELIQQIETGKSPQHPALTDTRHSAGEQAASDEPDAQTAPPTPLQNADSDPSVIGSILNRRRGKVLSAAEAFNNAVRQGQQAAGA